MIPDIYLNNADAALFVLVLNDMRASNIENSSVVCFSDSTAALHALLAAETVEPYVDRVDGRNWHKSFRAGGPLEWYNRAHGTPDNDGLVVNGLGHGILRYPSLNEILALERQRYTRALRQHAASAMWVSADTEASHITSPSGGSGA